MAFVNKRRLLHSRSMSRGLSVSFWYAGVVLLLLVGLRQGPGVHAACSCDSSVPPCQNPLSDIKNSSLAESACTKVARPDCPCCHVCAGQLGESCSQSQPCDSSQSLVCTTDKGCQKAVANQCLHDGRTYQPDETFYTQNCQTKCACAAEGGQTLCQPTTCRPGLLIRGFLAEDPLCEERQVDADDECCVLVVCSSVNEDDETSDDVTHEERHPKESPSLTSRKPEETSTEAPENEAFSTAGQLNNGSWPPGSSPINLEFLQTTPTTIQVQFPGITGGNLMYVEDRLFKGDGHDNFGHSATPWENAIILEGNEIFTLTGLKSKTTYRLRWQTPNKQYPDVLVETHAVGEKPPKVIVTSKTFDSVTLSFDHFAPDDNHHGYVAMYKEVKGGRWISHDDGDSQGEEFLARDLPSITINKLKPDTEYMARIAIYKDFETRSLGKSTAIIEFRTSKGCVYQNESYPLGPFYIGCESSCECSDDGTVECNDRCRPPYQPSGRTLEDPLCVEQFVEDDQCCVILTCAGNADEDDPEGPCKGIKCGPNAECRHEVFRGEGAETICVCKEGYSGDPDSQLGCIDPLGGSDRATVKPAESCIVKNETYAVGADWFDGCDYKCSCSKKLEILCQPRCKTFPDFTDERCELRPDPEDPCCKVMFCPDPKAMDDLKLVTVPFDGCQYKNLTYKQGERFYDSCEQQCQCMGYGDMVCVPRCPPTAPAPGQNCYTLPDASDPCCNITVCDKPVPDPDQNVPKESKQPRVINEFETTQPTTSAEVTTEESGDQPEAPTISAISEELKKAPLKTSGNGDKCLYKDQTYDVGAEFYDGCDQFCLCQGSDEGTEAICHPINCPSAFGLDIINPFCLEWDNHSSFEPTPPKCCPPQPICIHDGTCNYEGQKFNNFDNIPANLTGCEKRCYCENGEVLCQDACYDIPAEPPGYLACAATAAIKVPKDDRPCCLTWGCPKLELPKRLSSVQLESLNETSLTINLNDVPRSLNGRSGYIKVFYISGLQGHPDPDQWPSKTVMPKNGVFDVDEQDQAKFVLSDLLPNLQYFLRVELHARDGDEDQVIVSDIISGKTAEVQTTSEPSANLEIRRIDVNLTVDNVETTSAYLSWRFFTLEEKQFLDGVQIRFTELHDGSPASGVPGTTPFVHRDTNFFLLEDLKPATDYQVDLYLIPVANTNTELIANSSVNFRTKAPQQDPFDFTLNLKVDDVSKQTVIVSWTGVPAPQQKFVNIFRIIYLEDHANSLEGRSVFKVAKIDSSRAARISHLQPNTKYQFWMEAYLRNGKVIQSNVLEVLTEDGQYDPFADYDESQEPLSGDGDHRNNAANVDYYYKSMVAAIVIAVIVSAVLIIVGGLYLRRAITYKAIISGNGSRTESTITGKGREATSTLSSRGSGIAKSDSFEMNGMTVTNMRATSHSSVASGNGATNGNGNAKINRENP